MCCSEVQSAGRSPKSRAQRYLVVGSVAGVLLVLLTYLLVSQQFTISDNYVFVTGAQWITEKQQISAPDETDNGKVVCNSEGVFSESCEVDGDVRVNGTALSVHVVPASRSERREWRIRPYARSSVHNIRKVTVTQLSEPDHDAAAAEAAPACTVTYGVPAVLFAIGGHSGRNYFHDFTDVLVPLFAASRRYGGEVPVPGQQRRAASVAGQVRLHPAAAVPLFSIVPESAPGGLSMADFTAFLRETYALPRSAAVSSLARDEPGSRKPRLLLIRRSHYRKLVNEEEVCARGGGGGVRGDASAAEESTLLETLGPDHPAIRDPDSVHRSGWDKVDELYLRRQDVRVNVTRFAPTLAQAFQHLRRQ
ncbi:hypothetical protein EJB05_21079, partial [Eragrostis curvula]